MRPHLPLILLPCLLAVACGPNTTRQESSTSGEHSTRNPEKEGTRAGNPANKQLAASFAEKWFKALEAKEFAKAVEYYTEATRLAPDDDRAWFWRGQAHAESRQHDKAVAD